MTLNLEDLFRSLQQPSERLQNKLEQKAYGQAPSHDELDELKEFATQLSTITTQVAHTAIGSATSINHLKRFIEALKIFINLLQQHNTDLDASFEELKKANDWFEDVLVILKVSDALINLEQDNQEESVEPDFVLVDQDVQGDAPIEASLKNISSSTLSNVFQTLLKTGGGCRPPSSCQPPLS